MDTTAQPSKVPTKSQRIRTVIWILVQCAIAAVLGALIAGVIFAPTVT